MNKLVKRLLTGTLAFATVLMALPATAIHASGVKDVLLQLFNKIIGV